MKSTRPFAPFIVLLTTMVVGCSPQTSPPSGSSVDTTAIAIPQSIRAEHEEIHATLVEATQAPGRVGEAARALADVLHPHFVREEQIALPPLGLLAPLASGAHVPESVSSRVLPMTDALRAELPRMLVEHHQIRAAVELLAEAARAESSPKFEHLAEQLALHAKTEEEVLYPTAVLVGDLIRAQSRRQ